MSERSYPRNWREVERYIKRECGRYNITRVYLENGAFFFNSGNTLINVDPKPIRIAGGLVSLSFTYHTGFGYYNNEVGLNERVQNAQRGNAKYFYVGEYEKGIEGKNLDELIIPIQFHM